MLLARTPVVVLTCSLLVAACVDEPALAIDEAEVESGVIDDDDGPVANATVALKTSAGSCSGTLVTPRQVLTAAHCVRPRVGPNEPEQIVASTVTGSTVIAASLDPDLAGTGTLRLYQYELGGLFDAPWRPTVAPWRALRTAGAAGGSLWAVSTTDELMRRDAGGWVSLGSGSGGGVQAIAGTRALLVGIDAAGDVVMRTFRDDEPWTRIEAGPGHVVRGLAFDSDHRLYAAGPGVALTVRDGVGRWRRIGALPAGELESMTGDGRFLYARVGKTVYVRRAVPWEATWAEAGGAPARALLAEHAGELHAFVDGQALTRVSQRRWTTDGSTLPCVATALAVAAGRLWIACPDAGRSILRSRPLAAPAGPYLASPESIPIVAMTDGPAGLLATSGTGVFARAATSGARFARIETVTTPLTRLDVVGGHLWAIDEDEAVSRRPVAGGAWEPTGARLAADAPVFGGRTSPDELWALDDGWPRLRWLRGSLASNQGFTEAIRYDRFDPLRSYDVGPITVGLGPDLVNLRTCRAASQCQGRSVRFPAETDLALVDLADPVAQDEAVPVPVLLDGVPSDEAWKEQRLLGKGYGRTALPGWRVTPDAQVRLDGTGWTELGTAAVTQADGSVLTVVAAAVAGATGFVIDTGGQVWRRDGGVYRVPVPVSGPRRPHGVATDGGRLWLADRDLIVEVEPTTGAPLRSVASAPAGTWFTAIAAGGGRLLVATADRQLRAVELATGRVRSLGASPRRLMSLAVDAGGAVWGLSDDHDLYRMASLDESFAFQLEAIGVHAIAVDGGAVIGFNGGGARFRQSGEVHGLVRLEAHEAHGRGGDPFLSGDSGGPLFWTDASGRRVLAGVISRAAVFALPWTEGGHRFDRTFLPNARAWFARALGTPPPTLAR